MYRILIFDSYCLNISCEYRSYGLQKFITRIYFFMKIRKGFMEINSLTVSVPLSGAMLADIHRSANCRLDIPEVQEYVEGIRELERLINRSRHHEH